MRCNAKFDNSKAASFTGFANKRRKCTVAEKAIKPRELNRYVAEVFLYNSLRNKPLNNKQSNSNIKLMMRKRIFSAILLRSLAISVPYLVFVKKGFVYFTGISTPYSYFQARNVKKQTNLILYYQYMQCCIGYFNPDSLQKCYGFSWEHGGGEVSSTVIKLYNSVIFDELIHRISAKKWNEYLYKLDSLSNVSRKKFNNSILHH